MPQNRDYIRAALALAEKAAQNGDVPVGCIITLDGKTVSHGYNRREADANALNHAEIMAIDSACKKLNKWRLDGCVLYVTLEPCLMCAGAIVNARISRVVFGAYDAKAGAFGGHLDICRYALNHKPEITGGVLEDECKDLLKAFFGGLR